MSKRPKNSNILLKAQFTRDFLITKAILDQKGANEIRRIQQMSNETLLKKQSSTRS
jgi:hypothetical protein